MAIEDKGSGDCSENGPGIQAGYKVTMLLDGPTADTAVTPANMNAALPLYLIGALFNGIIVEAVI